MSKTNDGDERLVVGIDFGSKNIRAAFFIDGNFQIVKNLQNMRSTPSTMVLRVYEDLETYDSFNPLDIERETTYRFQEHKRVLCMDSDDFDACEDSYCYKLSKRANKVFIEIDNLQCFLRSEPFVISSKFLIRVRNDIGRMFGDDKTYLAVVTTPVCLNDNQKMMIKSATEKAGFELLNLISDPEAIAYDYYHFQNLSNPNFGKAHYFLVYDLGAGTFDLGLFQMIDRKMMKKIGVDGDINLGGFDFDSVLLEYVIAILRSDKAFKECLLNRQLKRKLRKECERVKMALSSFQETCFSITIYGYGCFKTPITCTRFEEMIEEKCELTIKILKSLLSECKISKYQIQEVILCGRATLTPQIEKLLHQFFSDTSAKLLPRINRSESAVKGAALYAAMCSKHQSQSIESIFIYSESERKIPPPKLDAQNQIKTIL